MPIKVNNLLKTKDGRVIGNAIVIEAGFINRIKTDYGNECSKTEAEIKELFYVEEMDEQHALHPHKFFVW